MPNQTINHKGQTLVWCRDKQNTWKTELEEEKTPDTLAGLVVDLDTKDKRIRFYDPWEDRWTDGKPDGGKIVLLNFRRALVVTVKS
jgi:hypothetical protein